MTQKKYTLQDLLDKKIAVRFRNYDEYKRLCEAVGDPFNEENYYSDIFEYYGFDGVHIVYMDNNDLQSRILLESIDMIDLEVKEEVKAYPFYYYAKGNYSCNCAVCKETFQGDKRATMCLECAIKQHHKDMSFAQSEITRLNGENERLNEMNQNLNKEINKWIDTATRYKNEITELQLRESPQISQDLTNRERMAWEYLMKSVYSSEYVTTTTGIDKAFELADLFLAKSKEVGNEK